MKAELEKKIKITLVLNEEEAGWLKSYLQNYSGLVAESSKDARMRQRFFNNLEQAGLL